MVELVTQLPERVPSHLVRHLGINLHRERNLAVPQNRHGNARVHVVWRDWSPGFQAREHLTQVKPSLRQPANLAAALGYYRPAGGAGLVGQPAGAVDRFAAEQQAVGRQAPQPTLYLHGARDGCIGVDLARGCERFLAPSSRMIVIDDAVHFLHLEDPAQVNDYILSWVS